MANDMMMSEPHSELETVLDSERSVSVDGHRLTIGELYGRHPGEDRQVVVTPHTAVEQNHQPARRWRYVFKIRDWTDRPRLDGEGDRAVLTHVYAPDEISPPPERDGYATIAVNSGTRVPDAILTAVTDTLDVEGFGRPPFIPVRDGEPVSPAPEWAEPTDGGGIDD